MEKKDYPIKYALLPVKEFRTGSNGSEYGEIVCYIVSKAYVVEEYKVRKNDDSYSTTYKVCFPNFFYSGGLNLYRKTPDSDLARDNEMVVSTLYDSLEMAQKAREEKNLLYSDEVLNNYMYFEDIVAGLTEDLTVTGENNIDKQKLLIKANKTKKGS